MSRRSLVWRLAVPLAVCGLCGLAAAQAQSSESAAAPTQRGTIIISPGVEFEASSYVHAKLPPDAPIDPRSRVWVASLVSQISNPYGTATVNINSYAPPVYIAPEKAPTVKVLAARASDPNWSSPALQAQFLDVPLPADFAPSAGTDKEAVVYQPSTGRYWEFWLVEPTGAATTNSAGQSVPQWRAAWGGQLPRLAANPGYFPTTSNGMKFGTTATGLALLGGLMTIAEQKRGVIAHALHIALPQVRSSVWALPARRTDGNVADPDAIPEGATFRLPAQLNLDAMEMDPYARMLAKAVQTYGLVVRDYSGAVAFYAENPTGMPGPDPYWGPGGILGCPPSGPVPACYPDSNNRLRGFPWAQLVAIKATLEP